MLKAARASVLILLLACSARAGYMQTGGSPVPPSPSQPACVVDKLTDAHEWPVAESVVRNDAPGALTQLALEVLAAMPSLF